MNFTGHATGATFAAIIAGGSFGFLEGVQIAVIAATTAWIGAVFPDLDIGSIPGRWFGRLGLPISCLFFAAAILIDSREHLALLVAGATPGFLALLCMSVHHRGPFHKYWIPLILTEISVAGYFLGSSGHELINPVLLSFAGGMSVHLILDGIFPWSFKGWFL